MGTCMLLLSLASPAIAHSNLFSHLCELVGYSVRSKAEKTFSPICSFLLLFASWRGTSHLAVREANRSTCGGKHAAFDTVLFGVPQPSEESSFRGHRIAKIAGENVISVRDNFWHAPRGNRAAK